MGKKILLVDNHPMTLKLMTGLLEKEGHHVLSAENGLAALDILDTSRPDIIFTDLVMPNIDGKKLCQVIRRRPNFKDIPIIILSAIAAEQEVDLDELGANGCIAKGPFNKMAQHILSTLDLLSHGAELLSGGIIGLDGIYQRQITAELLSVKRHFEVILGSMSEGILEMSEEGRIVYANPSAISLIGVPEESLLASSFVDLFRAGDKQRIKDFVAPTENRPRTIPEASPVELNGKQVSLTVLPVKDEDLRGMMVILNDVTERRRMEAQFLQSQKMEAIGTLAGGIAHDMNNLMMVVQGNVSLMLLDIDPSHPHYEMLKSIENKVKSGSRLTGQLLGYARKGRYEVKPIDLNQLVAETSEAFGRTRKDITVHRDLASDLFPIEADQGQIEQVLMNLMVNAADAMPCGGELRLKTANILYRDIQGRLYQPRPNDYVLLTVTDTGVGMDPKTLERIFDPFFTTKELGRGTGLGLASVYGIVKGHSGYIDVESEKGKGATFKIYLPASRKKAQDAFKTEELIVKGTETVLLVDDEEMVLEVGLEYLKALGYQVLTAHDGREAIEVYKKNCNAIDFVILDIVMPRMGGSETFDRLKEINPRVRVLLSSGYSIDGEATKILERGSKGFIQKPFDIEQLSKSIRQILDG